MLRGADLPGRMEAIVKRAPEPTYPGTADEDVLRALKPGTPVVDAMGHKHTWTGWLPSLWLPVVIERKG